MDCQEAIDVFESVKSKYDIPSEAELEFVEKRYIELPEDFDPEGDISVWDKLVWVGQYGLGASLYELACDMTGKIVRFRKGR